MFLLPATTRSGDGVLLTETWILKESLIVDWGESRREFGFKKGLQNASVVEFWHLPPSSIGSTLWVTGSQAQEIDPHQDNRAEDQKVHSGRKCGESRQRSVLSCCPRPRYAATCWILSTPNLHRHSQTSVQSRNTSWKWLGWRVFDTYCFLCHSLLNFHCPLFQLERIIEASMHLIWFLTYQTFCSIS